MTRFLASLAAFLALATGPALPADVPEIKYEKFKLANGLEVILVENHRLPLVAVNIWYHVGAINERPGLTGFAHLFEHMMFAGSKHVPRGVADQLADAAGATDANGSTDFDRTNYYDTWPSSQLDLALWIHSDRMGYMLDVLDQTALSTQQDVVRNERRQSYENRPYGIVEEALYHNLFPKAHPYYASVIGSHADIQAAKLEDIRGFLKLYYRPNNASLVIAGDIDKARAKKLVERYFGSLQRGPAVPPVTVETPPIASERRAVVKDAVELERLYVGWLTSPAYKPGDAELDAAAQILGGGKSSRLYKKLVYEMQIAQDVEVTQYSAQLTSIFQITVTARPGHTAKEIEAVLDAELERFGREGPDAKELERAQNTIESGLVRGFEKIGGGGLADRMNRYNQYLGEPGYLPKDIERYRGLTAQAVRSAAAGQLRKETRAVVYGVPGKQDLGPEVPAPQAQASSKTTESVNPEAPWRARPPAAAKAAPPKLPVPKTFRLANGLTVMLDERHGLPVVSASLVLRSGSDANPPGKPGLASFTADMLDEGTAKRSAIQIADDVAQLGATLIATSGGDSSSVTIASLKKNFAAALDILADVTLRPAFAPEEIERQRLHHLTSLVQVKDDPIALARRVAAAAVFGESNPFGYLSIGTEESVKATTRADLVAFWRQHYVPANAALVVSGDVSAADLKPLAEAALGSWKAGKPPRLETPPAVTTKARLVLVDKADAPQTALRIAKPGPARDTPDFPQLTVMNAALGGLFTSRINNNLREAKGYTYGASSVFQFHRATGMFVIGTSVRTEVTAPALAEVFKEVKAMRDKPVTREEWSRARDSQVRSLPGEFETSMSTVGSFAELFAFGLGLDYYAKLPARLNAVTPAAMQSAARKYLAPESLVVIVVGDRGKIEDGLRKLDLGKVEYRDTEARLIPGT